MRKEDIDTELTALAFDFFYWFSRFEFALKENNYLKSHEDGANAEPGWDEFVEAWQAAYEPSEQARALLKANPKRQVVRLGQELNWRPVGLKDCKSELAKVVRILKTVRNNLFHGGKHGAEGWDDPKRSQLLLVSGKAVLDQFAQLANLRADYTQYY